MDNRYLIEKDGKLKYIFIAGILILYIILFEFILPVNKILPKPSLLYETFFSLQVHYNLIINALYSVSGIYIPMLAAYLCLYLFAGWIIRILRSPGIFAAFLKIIKYFPIPGFVVIYAYWFPQSNISELFFTLIISLVYLFRRLKKEIPRTRQEYIDPFISVGADHTFINKNIIWKSSQPAVFGSLRRLNFYLWSVMLFFEYVKGAMGIGNIYRLALSYQDLSALIAVSIIICLIIFVADQIIKLLNIKLIEWES